MFAQKPLCFRRHFCISAVLTVFFVLFLAFPATVRAQQPNFGIANTYNIFDQEVKDGDIISVAGPNGELIRSEKDGDEKIFGVFVQKPQIVMRTGEKNPILRAGDALVNVTTLNGPVAVGDFVTSSVIPGKGQKVTKESKYILGFALEALTEEDGESLTYEDKQVKVGQIRVAISIGPMPGTQSEGGGLLGKIGLAFFSSVRSPEGLELWLRYLFAAFVAVLTLFFGYKNFGLNVRKGIESIGRNPLAKAHIETMVVLNMVMMIVVSIGGIILSLFIIRF